MLSKQEKFKFEELKVELRDEVMRKFTARNETLIMETKLKAVEKQLEDFKDLVNHLTSKEISQGSGDNFKSCLVGFCNYNGRKW